MDKVERNEALLINSLRTKSICMTKDAHLRSIHLYIPKTECKCKSNNIVLFVVSSLFAKMVRIVAVAFAKYWEWKFCIDFRL